MLNGGESADRMVDYTLKIGDTALRLSGTAAKNLMAFLVALSKDNRKTRGKARLVRMLKDGKELKVFQLDMACLKRFTGEARRYGILYAVLRDRKASDGTVDLLVKAEDASKVNRVLERIRAAVVEMGGVTASAGEGRGEENPTQGRARSGPSVNSSRGSDMQGRDERPSVRERLRAIKEQLGRQSGPAARYPRKDKNAIPKSKGR